MWSYEPQLSAQDQAEKAFKTFNAFIEGDDGICSKFEVNEQLIQALGIQLKMEEKPNYGLASFCGIVCPVGSRHIIYNPDKFLRNFFWLPIKFANRSQKDQDMYLRAKALSYLHSFGNCPIIGPISYEICKRTNTFNIKESILNEFDKYKRDQLTPPDRDWETSANNLTP